MDRPPGVRKYICATPSSRGSASPYHKDDEGRAEGCRGPRRSPPRGLNPGTPFLEAIHPHLTYPTYLTHTTYLTLSHAFTTFCFSKTSPPGAPSTVTASPSRKSPSGTRNATGSTTRRPMA